VFLWEWSIGILVDSTTSMVDANVNVGPVQPKKRTFKKLSCRGVDLDSLLDMTSEELIKFFHARA
jgi:small subunit ribosomal protein S15e